MMTAALAPSASSSRSFQAPSLLRGLGEQLTDQLPEGLDERG